MPDDAVTLGAKLERLSHEILKSFKFDEFDKIVHVVTEFDIASKWAAPGATHHVTIFKALVAFDQHDILPSICSELVKRRPQAETLRKLVREICPEAVTYLPIATEVSAVSSGLASLEARVGDVRVMGKLIAANVPLSDTLWGIQQLDVYKSLHELLHLMGVQQYRLMRSGCLLLSTESDMAASLMISAMQIRSICDRCREQVARLPGPDAVRNLERIWIQELDESAQRFEAAIVQTAAGDADAALDDIRNLLQSRLLFLNQNIALIAVSLPLDEIAALLGEIAAADGATVQPGDPPGVGIAARSREAHQAMKAIIPRIRLRVESHGAWQAIDGDILRIERLLGSQQHNFWGRFTSIWSSLKSKLTMALAPEDDSPTRQEILARMSDFEDAQARFQDHHLRVLDAAANAQADGSLVADRVAAGQFDLAFLRFCSPVQRYFLAVDKKLKRDLSDLNQVSTPLDTLIKAISA